jgi:hypothetical protein
LASFFSFMATTVLKETEHYFFFFILKAMQARFHIRCPSTTKWRFEIRD